jgi:hypothetical protein
MQGTPVAAPVAKVATRGAIAAEVRAQMARGQVTQVALSSSIGLSRVSLADRLAGRKAFNTDELFAIAAHLGCDVWSFLAPATSGEVASA